MRVDSDRNPTIHASTDSSVAGTADTQATRAGPGESLQAHVTSGSLSLLVRAKEVVSDGVVTLTLSNVRGTDLPEWKPGAHIDLIVGNGLVRQYSLCGDPVEQRTWQVAVQREQESRGGSQYIHDNLAVGDTVQASVPRNHFAFVRSPRYLFLAGGIGISPLLPMISAAEAAGTEWRLVYGGRTRASMAFRDELSLYGERVAIRPHDETGLLDLAGLLDQPIEDTQIYCCGPESMLLAVEEHSLSWPAGSLHIERFSPKEFDTPEGEEPFEVVLRRSGLTVEVPPGTSILHAVEQAGVSVLSSCQDGTCGTCETSVLDGVPDHRDSVLTESERLSGKFMMICVSRSCRSRLELDL